jgi:hypothetical protein
MRLLSQRLCTQVGTGEEEADTHKQLLSCAVPADIGADTDTDADTDAGALISSTCTHMSPHSTAAASALATPPPSPTHPRCWAVGCACTRARRIAW